MKRKYPAIPQLKAKLCFSNGQAILDLKKKTVTGPMTFTIEHSAYVIPKRELLKVAKQMQARSARFLSKWKMDPLGPPPKK